MGNTLGRYFMSDYVMEMDCKLADDQLAATMLHEYTHFIQDFTYYGIWVFICMHQILREFFVKYQQAESLIMPYEFKDFKEESRTNHVLMELAGRRSGKPFKAHKGEVERGDWSVFKRPTKEYEGMEFVGVDINTVEEVVICNKERKIKRIFGALDVRESMAYAIEQHAYGTYNPARQVLEYPYQTSQLVTEIVYPEFGKKPENVVALCDFALRVPCPGELFYDALVAMRDTGFLPATIAELYKHLVANLSFVEKSANEVNAAQRKRFFEEMKDFYGQLYSDTMSDVYRKILEHRAANHLFWAHGMTLPQAKAREYYMRLINTIGHPLLIDTSTGNFCFTGNLCEEPTPYYIYGMHKLNRLVHGSKFDKCWLQPKLKCQDCNEAQPWNNPPPCWVAKMWEARKLPKDVQVQ